MQKKTYGRPSTYYAHTTTDEHITTTLKHVMSYIMNSTTLKKRLGLSEQSKHAEYIEHTHMK